MCDEATLAFVHVGRRLLLLTFPEMAMMTPMYEWTYKEWKGRGTTPGELSAPKRKKLIVEIKRGFI